MATRKSKKADVGLHDDKLIRRDLAAGVPLVEGQSAEKADEPLAHHQWSSIASRLHNAIRVANSSPLGGKPALPITVVIPAILKDEQDVEWLIEAVESVIDQTVSVECVIVENGSNLLQDIYDGNISIAHSAKGLSNARNVGISMSKTEYFFPLDANDWLPSDALETIYAKRADTGFTYGSTMLFKGERGQGDQYLYGAKPYDFREVMKMVYFPNGALQRRMDWEKIGGYRETLTMLEDWDYWMTAGELGICGTAIQDVIYWYRQHGGIVQANNKSAEWEQTKATIQSLHRDIYKGVFPPMCCGNKNKAQAAYIPPTVDMLTAPGADGMTLIEYVGGNVGKMPWYGAVTGVRYEVGGAQKRFYIDARDALTGNRSNPGFLEIVDHGQPLFAAVLVEAV